MRISAASSILPRDACGPLSHDSSLWQATRALRAERIAQALAESERSLRQVEADQRQRAELAEQQAEEKAAVAQAVNDFMLRDLLALSSAEGQLQAGLQADPDLKLVIVLDRAAELLPIRFAKNIPERIELTRTLAEAYQGLGQYSKAAQNWEMLIQQEQTRGDAASQPVTSAKNNLAQSLSMLGKWQEAVVLFEEILGTIQEEDLGSPKDWLTRNNLAYSYLLLGQFERAIPHVEQARRRVAPACDSPAVCGLPTQIETKAISMTAWRLGGCVVHYGGRGYATVTGQAVTG